MLEMGDGTPFSVYAFEDTAGCSCGPAYSDDAVLGENINTWQDLGWSSIHSAFN